LLVYRAAQYKGFSGFVAYKFICMSRLRLIVIVNLIFVSIFVLLSIEIKNSSKWVTSFNNVLNVSNQSSIANFSSSGSDPYYGWQPKSLVSPRICSWLQCFRDSLNCSGSCLDDIHSWGIIEQNQSIGNQLPDVRMLRKMFLSGVDAYGHPWPPLISMDLCNPITMSSEDVDEEMNLIDGVPIRSVDEDSNISTSLFCLLYTMEEAHATRIRAIRETWAGMCDGFLAFSTKTDFRIPSISIPHKGVESYWNMWQKVRSIWKFVGQHYLYEFDYFLLGGDDIYVIPQNLRVYLSNLNGTPDDYHFLGRRFKKPTTNQYFYSGGSGYVLSRGALNKFLDTGYSNCHVDVESSEEDVLFADCLQTIANVQIQDTSDPQGRERFHPFSPRTHLLWRPDFTLTYSWYKEYSQEWGLQYGLNCCSPESVTFHYVSNPVMVRHLHCLIYGKREIGNNTKNEG
jgi:glycoprotein-N-acetylgalactosamine 3-beta-galactosyltransferase